MIKARPTKKIFYGEGLSMGLPCLLVDASDESAPERDINEVISEVLEFSRIKTVVIRGDLSKQNELVVLIRGLSYKSKKVIYEVPASCPIETVRIVRDLKVVMVMEPPNEKVNGMHPQNLQYLKEADELIVNVKSLKGYREAKKFLEPKTITRPEIIFRIHPDMKDVEELLEEYMQDIERFFFRSRVLSPLSL